MTFKPKDHYFYKAKEEGFAARSVYKLQEIDKKFKIFKPGQTVVDLGASPGSWSQWLSQRTGDKGKIIGFDLTEIKIALPNAIFFQADILETDMPKFLEEQGLPGVVDAVVSDMAPKTTGIKSADQAKSNLLCEMALHVADQILKPGGNFVCKYFQGNEFEAFRKQMRERFQKVEILKPDSTRSRSFEIFLIGINKK